MHVRAACSSTNGAPAPAWPDIVRPGRHLWRKVQAGQSPLAARAWWLFAGGGLKGVSVIAPMTASKAAAADAVEPFAALQAGRMRCAIRASRYSSTRHSIAPNASHDGGELPPRRAAVTNWGRNAP